MPGTRDVAQLNSCKVGVGHARRIILRYHGLYDNYTDG